VFFRLFLCYQAKEKEAEVDTSNHTKEFLYLRAKNPKTKA